MESLKLRTDGETIDLDKAAADQAQIDARAKRVILVNSSGDIIKGTPIIEERSGVDLVADVLILQNTSESGNPVSVWVDLQLIATADYTVTHLSSSSTIEFTGISPGAGTEIKVRYYI